MRANIVAKRNSYFIKSQRIFEFRSNEAFWTTEEKIVYK